jgi:hypothetical protein
VYGVHTFCDFNGTNSCCWLKLLKGERVKGSGNYSIELMGSDPVNFSWAAYRPTAHCVKAVLASRQCAQLLYAIQLSLQSVPFDSVYLRQKVSLWENRSNAMCNKLKEWFGTLPYLLMGTTPSESIPVCGLYCRCLTMPGSITYTMPSTVTDVSAMFVATTTFRQPGGGGRKMRTCT